MINQLFSHFNKNKSDLVVIALLIAILVFTIKGCNVENFRAKTPHMDKYGNIDNITCPTEGTDEGRRAWALKQAASRSAIEAGRPASTEQINAAATLAPLAGPSAGSTFADADTDNSGDISEEEAMAAARAAVV